MSLLIGSYRGLQHITTWFLGDYYHILPPIMGNMVSWGLLPPIMGKICKPGFLWIALPPFTTHGVCAVQRVFQRWHGMTRNAARVQPEIPLTWRPSFVNACGEPSEGWVQ